MKVHEQIQQQSASSCMVKVGNRYCFGRHIASLYRLGHPYTLKSMYTTYDQDLTVVNIKLWSSGDVMLCSLTDQHLHNRLPSIKSQNTIHIFV